MNDHVGKPVELTELVSVLLHHTGRCAGAPPTEGLAPVSTSARPPANTSPDTLPHSADDALASDAAIQRLGGGRAFYLKLLRTFQGEAVAQLSGAHLAQAEQRWTDAVRHLHTLKGIASTIGATALAAQAARAEAELGGLHPSAQTHAQQQALEQTLNTTLRHVATALEDASAMSPGEPQPVAPAFNYTAFAHALGHLMQLLQNRDMDSTTACDALSQQFSAALGPRLQAVQQAVDQLDFAQALHACQALQASVPE